MTVCSWVLGTVALGWGQDPKSAPRRLPRWSTAADVITFRDGKVLLGQVVESADRRGPLRRPGPAGLGGGEPAPTAPPPGPRPKRRRSARPRRSVGNDCLPGDGHGPAQSSRPTRSPPGSTPRSPGSRLRDRARRIPPRRKSPLMVVRLARNTIKALDHKPKATGRLLRLAWTMNFADPETTPLADLKQGWKTAVSRARATPRSRWTALLPIPLEPTRSGKSAGPRPNWRTCPGGRFLLYGGAVLPEPAPGEAPPAGAAMEALTSTLKDLLGEGRQNPLPAKFRELAARGRVGAVVTSLEMAPDMASTTVATTLWVAPGGNRDWVPALVRSSHRPTRRHARRRRREPRRRSAESRRP